MGQHRVQTGDRLVCQNQHGILHQGASYSDALLLTAAQGICAVVGLFLQSDAGQLGKGVVHAKDTVNFIGNRIGCYFMLSGLHKAKSFLADGMSQETVDAVLGKPIGLPPTGLYGLIDLIGLDVMYLVPDDVIPGLPITPGERALSILASGYTLAFDRLESAGDRAMIAPRMLGPEVRSCYEEGVGFITGPGVERDARHPRVALAVLGER